MGRESAAKARILKYDKHLSIGNRSPDDLSLQKLWCYGPSIALRMCTAI